MCRKSREDLSSVASKMCRRSQDGNILPHPTPPQPTPVIKNTRFACAVFGPQAKTWTVLCSCGCNPQSARRQIRFSKRWLERGRRSVSVVGMGTSTEFGCWIQLHRISLPRQFITTSVWDRPDKKALGSQGRELWAQWHSSLDSKAFRSSLGTEFLCLQLRISSEA